MALREGTPSSHSEPGYIRDFRYNFLLSTLGISDPAEQDEAIELFKKFLEERVANYTLLDGAGYVPPKTEEDLPDTNNGRPDLRIID